MNSIETLYAVLENKGYSLEKLSLGGDVFALLSAPNGKQWLTEYEAPNYPFVTSSARKLSRDKAKLYEFMQAQGLSVPKTISVSRDSVIPQEALDELKGHKLIVKPCFGEGGKGLTLDIASQSQLRAALKKSHSFHKIALIQRQFIGEEYRFTVLDGKVCSILLRQTPQVIGDGENTLESLIVLENKQRSAISHSAATYPLLDENIIGNELITSKRVIPKGGVVKLGRGTMIKTGASMYEMIEKVHETYSTLVENAIRPFGDGFLAVDLIIADSRLPVSDEGYIFLETNLNPALVLYNSCRQQSGVVSVVDSLANKLQTVIGGYSS